VNQGTNDGITPLAVAIYQNQTEVAKFLLRKNANIESTKFVFREFGKLELIENLEKMCKEIKQVITNGIVKRVSDERICAVCRELSKVRCSACKNVWYCGEEHQKEHWKIHKVECSKKTKN